MLQGMVGVDREGPRAAAVWVATQTACKTAMPRERELWGLSRTRRRALGTSHASGRGQGWAGRRASSSLSGLHGWVRAVTVQVGPVHLWTAAQLCRPSGSHLSLGFMLPGR